MPRPRPSPSRVIPLAAALAVAAVLACATPVALAAGGARVTLTCERDGGPADVAACLARSRLEISREGVKTTYRADDLAGLDDPADGALDLTMPRNFSLKAQNTGTEAVLTLTVRAPGGATVHTARAKPFEWVQFYHCGPQVNPTCRDYRGPAE